MSGRGSSAGFRRTYLVGSARSVFSHRSMRISYDDSRGSTAAETARCIRRAREKKAARPNNDPPTKVRTMIDCSICMWIFWAESVQDAKIANGNRATEPQAKRSTPCCTSKAVPRSHNNEDSTPPLLLTAPIAIFLRLSFPRLHPATETGSRCLLLFPIKRWCPRER